MPNIALTKSDGLALNLPASSYTCILSAALDVKNPDVPSVVRSVVMSNYRGMSVYTLAHSAADVAEQIANVTGDGPSRAFVRLEAGDDASFFEEGSILGFEEMRRTPEGDEEGVVQILVHFRKHDGEPAHQFVDRSDENTARLKAAVAVPAATSSSAAASTSAAKAARRTPPKPRS